MSPQLDVRSLPLAIRTATAPLDSPSKSHFPYPNPLEEPVRNRALRIISGIGGVTALVALMPGTVIAQEASEVQAVLDNIWVFIAGCLVFFMQAGFALVEAGLTRAKNVVNIFAKNMADAIIGILAFFCTGYALAFSSGNDFFGTEGGAFFMKDLDINAIGGSGVINLSHGTFFFFQAVFAATAVTITSGSHGRADEVHVVPHLRCVHVRHHLSGRGPHDLGRWLHRRHFDR